MALLEIKNNYYTLFKIRHGDMIRSNMKIIASTCCKYVFKLRFI